MLKKSIWELEDERGQNRLIKDQDVDVMIIGGGITGVTLAYLLKDTNKRVMLVDKGKLGYGVTSRTTAKITCLQGEIYGKLEKRFGKGISKKYYQSQKDAIQMIKGIVEKEKISCDFQQVPSIVFTTEDKNVKKIKKEKEILDSFGEDIKEVHHPKIKIGIKKEDTYVFHPLKYLKALEEKFGTNTSVYEKSLVTNIEKKDDKFLVRVGGKTVTASFVAVTCHYPFFLFPSFIPLKTYVKREYVNVGKVKDTSLFSAVNVDKDLHSIRFYQNYLIYGSNAHKLTSKIDYAKNMRKSQQEFERYFHRPVDYSFLNQDITSHDDLPLIGKMSRNIDGLFVATAYRAWGMTNGTIAAKIIYDLIEKKQNPYISLFDPTRKNIFLLFNGFLGMFSYLKVYAQALWKKSNPSYIKVKGITYAIYKDKDGICHKISLICPHMKCNLVFNEEEKTWDCPCHGSRFTVDGKLIEGPSKKNLSEKEV